MTYPASGDQEVTNLNSFTKQITWLMNYETINVSVIDQCTQLTSVITNGLIYLFYLTTMHMELGNEMAKHNTNLWFL
jgi:hypothetical protein